MLKKIFLGFGLLVVAVLGLAAMGPSEMNVSREITIAATPEVLFPYINNSKKSYEWMPWAEGDPGIQIQFTGPAEGVGASSNWDGKNMGTGKSEVVESVTNQVVKTKLTYTKPFNMEQLAEVGLTPAASGTVVKWSVSGHQNLFFKLMGLFVNCDKMIGTEFEKGLNKLKVLAETKK